MDGLPQIVLHDGNPILQVVFPNIGHCQPVEFRLDFHTIDLDVGPSVGKDQGDYPAAGSQIQQNLPGSGPGIVGKKYGIDGEPVPMPPLVNQEPPIKKRIGGVLSHRVAVGQDRPSRGIRLFGELNFWGTGVME